MLSTTSWFILLGTIGLQVTALLVCAALASRFTREAKRKRALWQAVLVAVGVLLVSEATGLPSRLTQPTAPSQSVDRVLRVKTVQTDLKSAADPEVDSGKISMTPVRWPGWLWVSGSLVFFGLFVLRKFWLVVERRRMLPCKVDQAAQSVFSKLGGARVSLNVWDRVNGPVAFGIWRPTVAIPTDFSKRYTASQREVMLAHELAHLALRDPAWFAMVDLLCALLWWHPMVWWARRSFCNTCEAAADEASALFPKGPIRLAESLVLFGRDLRLANNNALAAGGDGARTQLRSRVEALLESDVKWHPLSAAGRWTPRLIGTCLVSSLLTAPWHGQSRPFTTVLADSLSLSGKSETVGSHHGSTKNPLQPTYSAVSSVPSKDGKRVMLLVEFAQIPEQHVGTLENLYPMNQRLEPAELPGRPDEILSLTNLSNMERIFASRSGTQGQMVLVASSQFATLRKNLKDKSGVEWLTPHSGGAGLKVGSGTETLAQVVDVRTVVCDVEVSDGTETKAASVNYKTEEIFDGPEARIVTKLTEHGWLLDVSARCLEFLGYEDRKPLTTAHSGIVPAPKPLYVEQPSPHFLLREARAALNAFPGQTAVLRGPLRKGNSKHLRGSTHQNGPSASRLYIFFTLQPAAEIGRINAGSTVVSISHQR